MEEEKSIEMPQIPSFDGVLKEILEILNSVSIDGEVPLGKDLANQIKLVEKALSLSKEFGYPVPGSEAFKTAAIISDFYLAIDALNEAREDEKFNTDKIFKGIFYTGSAVGKISGNKTLSGLSKIGRGAVDLRCFDYSNFSLFDYSTKEQKKKNDNLAAVICSMVSGVADLVAQSAAAVLSATTLSFFFMMAAEQFKHGHTRMGYLFAGLGIVFAIVLGIAGKAFMSACATALSTLTGVTTTTAAATVALIPVVAGIIVIVAPLIAALFTAEQPTFAHGGFPATGQTFIAREAGPELVGTIGNRNAVVNNDQIVESVSRGVYSAFKSAIYSSNSKDTAIARVYLDGKLLATA